MKLEILVKTYKGTNTQARKSLDATEKYENLTQMEVLCIILKTYYELTFTKCPCHVRTGMKHKNLWETGSVVYEVVSWTKLWFIA